MELPITVGEAVNGADVEVPTPVGAVKVKIPAGAQSGQRLRIKVKEFPLTGKVRRETYICADGSGA